MMQKYGFTKLTPGEFQSWIAAQSISRTCKRIQQHHTWKPRYANFTGSNHFELQRNMRRHHINVNGWSDIGQHFSIFPDGDILTGRPLNTSPACIYRANADAICIENLGNFDQGGDDMTSDQAASIFSTTAALLRKIGISAPSKTNVVYHHWYDGNGNLVFENSGQKSCPGTNFFGGNKLADFDANFLPRLRAEMGASPAPVPSGLRHWASVTADRLNIRQGPSSQKAVVDDHGPLEFGAVVRVYEKAPNGWCRISQSKEYWIYGRHTREVQPATVNTVDTNARLGAGMQHDIARVLQPGDSVFIFGEADRWWQIADDLWVHKTLLDLAS